MRTPPASIVRSRRAALGMGILLLVATGSATAQRSTNALRKAPKPAAVKKAAPATSSPRATPAPKPAAPAPSRLRDPQPSGIKWTAPKPTPTPSGIKWSAPRRGR